MSSVAEALLSKLRSWARSDDHQSKNGALAIVMWPARLFLVLGWTRAGVEKLIDADWRSGDYLSEFLRDQQDVMLPIAAPVRELVDVGFALPISFAVILTELTIAALLVTRRYQRHALWVACLLNVSFVAFGVVAPSAFYLVLQMTVLLALAMNRPPLPDRQVALSICVWTLAALVMLPFVNTLHPRDVIEDPAVMLATLALLRVASLLGLAIWQRDQTEVIIDARTRDESEPAPRRSEPVSVG